MEDKIQQERKEIVYLKRENVCLKKEIEQLNIELNNKQEFDEFTSYTLQFNMLFNNLFIFTYYL